MLMTPLPTVPIVDVWYRQYTKGCTMVVLFVVGEIGCSSRVRVEYNVT
jgi:uncharacterized membrane protein YqjE